MGNEENREQILDVFRKSDGTQRTSDADRVRLHDISPTAYEHPLDRAALKRLRQVPMLSQVLRTVFGTISERSMRLLYLAHSVRVGPNQFPELHATLIECCEILDIHPIPELFVAQNPLLNAGAVGMKSPFIVINSGTLELYSNDELRFVIGHELGHILSGHVLYKTLLKSALKLTMPMFARLGLPVAGIALHGLVAALMEWDRKSELSADRAGLLCSQDPEVSFTSLMRIAGGRFDGRLNLDAFIQQAQEYESAGDHRDSALKVLNLLGQAHPFPVLRIAHLKRWFESGVYDEILNGDYTRRSDQPDSADEEILGDAQSDASETSEDPLAGIFKSISDRVSDAGHLIRSQLRDIMDSKNNHDDEEG